jgi:hypothetical protein
MNTKIGIYLTIFFAVFLAQTTARAQSVSPFEITQSVIAGGGAPSAGGAFRVEGTTGQSIAGTPSNAAPFDLQSGFWTAEFAAPPAATVTVTGRALKANGRGLPRVNVTLTEQNGDIHRTRTDPFGNFRFDNIAVGQTVIIQVFAHQYQFLPKIIAITENMPPVVLTPP